jgi:hypothetical protein
MEYLNEQFPDRWIGNADLQNWSRWSPDLTLLDSHVWGHMKNMVYECEVNRRQNYFTEFSMPNNT